MTGALYINGKWQKGLGKSFTSIAPARGDIIWQGHEADDTQVHDAIAAAHAAFQTWRKLSLEERMSIVEKFTALLQENKDAMAATISKETGKALWDAATEAGAMAGKAALSLKAYNERTGTLERDLSGTTLRIAHRPHGVMAVIGPFNFPGHLPNGQIIPALISGNTVVFKPSEMTPMVAEKTVELWDAAGLPKGVINLVHGGRNVGEALISDERIRGILFTGGITAGRAIHKALAGHPDKLLALELGGNNPLIVWNVADKVSAARIIIRSVFITSGQRCTCAKRLIIPDGQQGDDIITSLRNLVSRLIVDYPDAQPEPFMGAMISTEAATAVLTAQEQFLVQGGKAILPCTRLSQGNAFLSPGIIDVTDVQDRPDEEVFGPLLQVVRVKSFEIALEEANDTEFGLAAGLISDDRALFDHFINEINAGIVNWNRQTTGASGAAPFGGTGLSGNHRPAGFTASDFSAWPVASLIAEGPVHDETEIKGLLD